MSEAESQLQEARPRRFRRYPAYKNSGVESLGSLPADWQVKRLWHLTPPYRRIMYGIVLPGPHVEDGVPIVKGGDVSPDRLRLDRLNRTTREIESGYARSRLKGGDLVYAIRGSIGEVAIVPDELEGANLTQDAARVAFSPGVHGRWLLFALKSRAVFAVLEAGALGATISGINVRDLKRASVPVPPVTEQRAIGAFLERETARIDALVAKKERLIELLHEKRSALITRVVTEGLDPDVSMKDSGVEWLGEIPTHWRVAPLKRVANFVNGFAFKPDEWTVEGTPIIRIENLNGGEDFNCTVRELQAKYCAEKGDLLFGWSGNRGTSFGPFLWWRAGRHYVNQHIFRVVDFDVDRSWLYWVLRGVTFYVEKQAHGIIGMVHITRGELGVVPIPVVPREEQERIACFLDQENARLDALVTKVREASDRLLEFRAALISAAVTGKIDVRREAEPETTAAS
jgi:type I restriction enzyme, S subunit